MVTTKEQEGLHLLPVDTFLLPTVPPFFKATRAPGFSSPFTRSNKGDGRCYLLVMQFSIYLRKIHLSIYCFSV
jgi:hypothetical protein